MSKTMSLLLTVAIGLLVQSFFTISPVEGSTIEIQDEEDSPIKRDPNEVGFNAWKGKRSDEEVKRTGFNAWSGKRGFKAWSGKRSGFEAPVYVLKYHPEYPSMEEKRFAEWKG